MSKLADLIDFLDDVGSGKLTPDSGGMSLGLCFHIDTVVGCDCAIVTKCQRLMTTWPEYSGSREYPVPHPTLHPMDAYDEVRSLYTGEYGAARRRLAAYLCVELTKLQQEGIA